MHDAITFTLFKKKWTIARVNDKAVIMNLTDSWAIVVDVTQDLDYFLSRSSADFDVLIAVVTAATEQWEGR